MFGHRFAKVPAMAGSILRRLLKIVGAICDGSSNGRVFSFACLVMCGPMLLGFCNGWARACDGVAMVWAYIHNGFAMVGPTSRRLYNGWVPLSAA